MNRPLNCLLLVYLLVACKEKERIVEVPEPKADPALSWQVHPDFLFDRKVQLSSYADSSIIMLSGIRTTAIAPSPARRSSTDTTFVHFGGQAENNGRTDYRPLLNPTFFGFLYNETINILSTANPVLSYSNARIDMRQVDADFASFYVMPIEFGETLVANQRNQCIVPYYIYDRSYNTPVLNGNQTPLLLFSVTTRDASPGILQIAQTQKIILPRFGLLCSMTSIGDNFIVSVSSGTYRITPDGAYLKTYPHKLLRQFTINKTAYGFTYGNTNDLRLIASADQGNTWTTIATNLPDDYWRLSYRTVQNQLIATYNSQLFRLTITPTTLTSVELDNTGLEGNRITSVAQFRNTVYVSTLSGVFTKPVRTFLTPKKEK